MTKLRTARLGVAVLAMAASAGAWTIAAAPAQAATATRYVATTGDDGTDPINDCTVKAHPCQTIQHAVDEANPGDTVSILDKGPYAEAVHVAIPLTIVGRGATGAGKTVVDGSGNAPSITVDGTEAEAPVVVTVKDLAVDGNASAAGIFVTGATLHLVDSSASGNTKGAGVQGVVGGVVTVAGSTIADNLGGIVSEPAQLTVTGSSVTGNALGGILQFGGSAQISDSTVSDNGGAATGQGGGLGFGLGVLGGTATVERSTLDGNTQAGVYVFATPQAGVRAPSVFTPNVTAAISASTIAHNGFSGVAVGPGAAATIDRSTLAGNAVASVFAELSSTTITNSTATGATPGTVPGSVGPVPQGGLVYIATAPGPAVRRNAAHRSMFTRSVPTAFATKTLARSTAPSKAPEATEGIQLTGTINADNTTLPDCLGVVIDGGYNDSSDAANSCGFAAAKHDLVKTDPKLASLANNGGPTATEIPKKGSPVIDAIAAGAAECVPGVDDQRGVARPQPTGGRCDIGAVELAANPLAIHPDSLAHGTVGKAYAQTITATGGQYPSYVFSLVAGALPDGLSFSANGKITGTPTKAGAFHFTVSVNDPVTKAYTIVIDAAAGTNGDGTAPIAATGAPVVSMGVVGGGALLAGFAMLIGAGLIGRRPGRHRAQD